MPVAEISSRNGLAHGRHNGTRATYDRGTSAPAASRTSTVTVLFTSSPDARNGVNTPTRKATYIAATLQGRGMGQTALCAKPGLTCATSAVDPAQHALDPTEQNFAVAYVVRA